MKFIHPLLSEAFEISQEKINILVLENKKTFVEFVNSFLNQSNGLAGDIIINAGEKKLIDISKHVDVVINPFELNFNDKKYINTLHTELAKAAHESENFIATQELLTNVNNYLEKLLHLHLMNLTYEDKFDITGIFKLATVKFSEEPCGFIDKIINYMEILTVYANIKCFVFVNLKSFLSDEDLISFYEDILYKKFTVLLLENFCSEQQSNYENRLIVDCDLCII